MRLRDFFFFFNDTATTEIYTLSLHDALPISMPEGRVARDPVAREMVREPAEPGLEERGVHDRPASRPLALDERREHADRDRKSTRLNSSHSQISYAVFCLKKKKKI